MGSNYTFASRTPHRPLVRRPTQVENIWSTFSRLYRAQNSRQEDRRPLFSTQAATPSLEARRYIGVEGSSELTRIFPHIILLNPLTIFLEGRWIKTRCCDCQVGATCVEDGVR